MRTGQLILCFEPLRKLRTRLYPLKPAIYITGRSKAVVLMWCSMLLVLVSDSVLYLPSVCPDDLS